jgi:hypothetical protein
MKNFTFILGALVACARACTDPDCDLSFIEICEKNNFKVETH